MGPPMYTVSGQLAHMDKKNNVANDAIEKNNVANDATEKNNVANDATENGDNDSDEVMEEAEVMGKRTRSNGANGGPEAKRGRV